MDSQKHKLSEYDETIRLVLESGGEFRLYPRGTSMLPLLVQGRDSVVLKKITEKPKKGDILFYKRNSGAYVLHRMIGEDSQGYIICGDNHTTLEHGITDSHLIGIVTRIYRGENCLELNCLRYRLYTWLWKSFTVRRIYYQLRNLKKCFKKHSI